MTLNIHRIIQILVAERNISPRFLKQKSRGNLRCFDFPMVATFGPSSFRFDPQVRRHSPSELPVPTDRPSPTSPANREAAAYLGRCSNCKVMHTIQVKACFIYYYYVVLLLLFQTKSCIMFGHVVGTIYVHASLVYISSCQFTCRSHVSYYT